MNNKDLVKISKFLSLVLRHKPESIGLKLDENGWAFVDDLLVRSKERFRNLNKDVLFEVVEKNNKKRFALNDDNTKIRASQGHSVNIDLSLKPIEPPNYLFHGTSTKNWELIKNIGLKKQNRQFVHLSKDKQTAINVGRRHGTPVVLKIMAKEMYNDGFKFYLSENLVWLTDSVPIKFISIATK